MIKQSNTTYLFQCVEILLAHPRNFLDSLKFDIRPIVWKLRYRRCCQPTFKLWMFLLNDIQNVLGRQSMGRSKYDSFPVILVWLVVQSSDMGPSNITEVDIFGTRQVSAGRDE
jgi:hypothetical protein